MNKRKEEVGDNPKKKKLDNSGADNKFKGALRGNTVTVV
jgi:hypothetical protein